jgi:hypothetical protein
MILRLFKGTGPGVIILISLTILLLWVGSFINPAAEQAALYDKYPLPLYSLLKTLLGSVPFAGVLFSMIVVSVIAFLAVSFNTADFFIHERTFLPAFFYILLSGIFPGYQVLNPVIPASLFLLFAIIRINDVYRKAGTANNFFDAGLLIGTGSLFYGNLIWFILIILIGIAIYRSFNIIEIATAFIGIFTPWVLTFCFNYIFAKDPGSLIPLLKNNLAGLPELYLFSTAEIVVLSVISLIILISFVYLLMTMNSKKIKSRKTFYLLIWVFLVTVALYAFVPSVSVEIVWILFIPFSYLLTHYFLFIKRGLFREILFYLLLSQILLMQILHLV